MTIGLIQLWRRVTDSTLIDECTDDILIDNTTVTAAVAGGGICFERARSRKCLSLLFSVSNEQLFGKETRAVRGGYSLISHFSPQC